MLLPAHLLLLNKLHNYFGQNIQNTSATLSHSVPRVLNCSSQTSSTSASIELPHPFSKTTKKGKSKKRIIANLLNGWFSSYIYQKYQMRLFLIYRFLLIFFLVSIALQDLDFKKNAPISGGGHICPGITWAYLVVRY